MPTQKIRNDLTSNLIKSLQGQRVSVFIDAANLYHASAQAGIKIDFIQIANWFRENISPNVNLRFYSAYDPDNDKQIEFLNELVENGFNVVKKPIKDFGTFIKGNMDIELAVDAITYKDNFDTLVLISGDGDFTYLVNSLEKNYKKTAILSIGGFTSYELHLIADSYYFMNRIAKVWQTPKASSTTTISTDDFQYAYYNDKNNRGKDSPKKEKIILKVEE